MTDTVEAAILRIRDTCRTNMFDVNTVQRIAFELDELELVDFIEYHRHDYVDFILRGKHGHAR